MKDRISGSPGRYRAIVETSDLQNMKDGYPFNITLSRDDDPIEDGTPYCKDTILPDDVADALCPGMTNPNPADALRSVASAIDALRTSSGGGGNADALQQHISNKENPHGVTAKQIKAVLAEDYEELTNNIITHIDSVQETSEAHIEDRENPHGVTAAQVGAAPAGFGLGENASRTENWNAAFTNGFMRGNSNSPDKKMWYGIVCRDSANNAASAEIAFCVDAGNVTAEARRSRNTAGTWGEWEYVNPPMLPEVEYRTTERWNGKPVYKKLSTDGKLYYRIGDGEFQLYSELIGAQGGGGTSSTGYISGTTDEITPSQVAEAINKKQNVYITLDDPDIAITFSNFTQLGASLLIASTFVINQENNTASVVQLHGDLSTDMWHFSSASELQGAPGQDGLTPFINAEGNWQIGDNDTGVKAKGDDYVLTPEDKHEIASEVMPSYITTIEKLKTFVDNTDIDYAFDSTTNANYTVIRIYKNKIDGTKQYPFVYAPNGVNAGTKTTYNLSHAEGWLLAINAGVFDTSNCKPDGILIQNGEVLQGTPTATHSQCKPLTIDRNGNLGSAAYNADADELVGSGIVSAVTGFMPIIVDYEPVPSSEWNSVDHYTQNAQRQIIGQFGNGDYAIITCEGRGHNNSDGWTIEEAQNICRKHGLKFAYNLDGGGSTETMLGLKHMNTIYEGTTGRKVPTFIVFNGSTVFGKPDEPIEPDIPDDPEYVVPEDYTEVEYIQTNGSQYVVTDIPETELFDIEYKALNENWTTQAGHILSSANTFYPFMKTIDGTRPWIGNKVWGNEQSGGDCEVSMDKSQAYTIRGVYDGSEYTMYFDGTAECSVQAGTTKTATNFCHLFTYGGNASSTNYRFTGKLYYLKLWSLNGTLAHNYVPVKNSSGVYGLFDTVTEVFHASGTSAAFSGA